MLIEEIKHIDSSNEAVKKTGLTVGIVLILVSLLLWYLGKTSFVYFSSIGGLFVILAITAIPVLRPFHKLWMMLSLLMGFVMSRVILTLLFYIVLTPVGFIAKLVGKKFMPLGFDKNAKTYWEKRENAVKQQIDYERQF
ncbi:MAG TPA: SxtJ family membrane protein [Ignavibacteriaceae bacterium]|nr:SxtJ family membrane protein [Ignavibacteriaceae bacterium]